MPNTLLDFPTLAREAALQVRNALVFSQACHIGYEDDVAGRKQGATIPYEKPTRVLSFDGATLGTQNAVEQNGTIVLEHRKHVPLAFTTQEMTLSLKEFSRRWIQPAAIALANDIDVAVAQAAAQQLPRVWGTPGQSLRSPSGSTTFDELMSAGADLADQAVPIKDRMNMHMLLSPRAYAGVVGGLGNVFSTRLTEDQQERGIRGEAADFQLSMGQNVHRHTTGTLAGGTAAVNSGGGVSSGTSLPVDTASVATGTLKIGDVFTVAGVNEVNPITKQDLGYLKHFVVTADTAMVANAGTITFAPAIVTSGAYQNASAAMGNGNTVTFLGAANTTYPVQIAMHKHALSLITAPLELPDAPYAARATMEGINVRIVKDYTISSDENVFRMDVLFGVAASYPEWGVRYFGGE